jgi:hypothetical protein
MMRSSETEIEVNRVVLNPDVWIADGDVAVLRHGHASVSLAKGVHFGYGFGSAGPLRNSRPGAQHIHQLESDLLAPGSFSISGKRPPAKLEALSDFLYRIGALRNVVLEFD